MEPAPPDLDDVRARARAAFLGLALGDALGATVEFLTANEIRASLGVHRELTGGGWLQLKPGRVTDDTEMSLALARAIDRSGGFDRKACADALAVWLKGNPIDVGSTVRKGIRNYIVFGHLETPPNEWDAGNGAAMRLLPVALCHLGDPEAMAGAILAEARLTHHHPLSDAACLTLARMLEHALLGRPLARLRAEADALVASHPTFRFVPYKGRASGYVVETMQTVFHHLFTVDGFEPCLVAVVNQGGDADTTGAIAGMLAGALHGPAQLPPRWLKKLDRALASELSRLATRLVDLSPLARGAGA